MPDISLSLAGPLLGMCLLTAVVWTWMYVTRLRFLTSKGIDAQDLADAQDVVRIIPATINAPANNLRNLTEVPVVFYAVCLYLMVAGQVDAFYLNCAWAFLGLRVLHSLVQCSYNRVMHRFAVYSLSTIIVWVMVARAGLAWLST